jgi:hypothetical protein
MTEMAPLIKAFNIINYSNTIERAVEVRDHKTLAELKLRLQRRPRSVLVGLNPAH